MSNLEVGQFFASFDVLRTVIQDWSIRDKFTFRTRLRDRQRVDYCCHARNEGCFWRVFATTKEEGIIQIQKIDYQHSWLGAALPTPTTANSQSWLLRIIPQLLIVTRETTVQDIINPIRLHHHEQIYYQAAHETKSRLLQTHSKEQARQFECIPAYLAAIIAQSPFIYTNLLVVPHVSDALTVYFRRVFICPAESQLWFIQHRKFLAVDRTFLKANFQQTLLLAVTVDANGHYLLLAWAIVESENAEAWEYFFSHLKRAIPQVLDASIISNREKGLHSGMNTLGNGITRLHCLEQLRQNFIQRNTQKNEGLFWKIANSSTEKALNSAINNLQRKQPTAATYLLNINRSMWVTTFIPGVPKRRYGQRTSNPVEVMYSVLRKARELSVLDLLSEIWHHTMETRFTHFESEHKVSTSQIFTPYCEKSSPVM